MKKEGIKGAVSQEQKASGYKEEKEKKITFFCGPI